MYRAHWEELAFEGAIASAREGLRLLHEHAALGISLAVMTADDWAFLLSLCDDGVRAMERDGDPAWVAAVAQRARVESFFRDWLEERFPRQISHCVLCE